MYKNKLNKILDLIKNDLNSNIISNFLEWFYNKMNIEFKKNIEINFLNNEIIITSKIGLRIYLKSILSLLMATVLEIYKDFSNNTIFIYLFITTINEKKLENIYSVT